MNRTYLITLLCPISISIVNFIHQHSNQNTSTINKGNNPLDAIFTASWSRVKLGKLTG